GGLAAVEIEGIERVLLVVVAEAEGDVPAIGDVEGHVSEDREAFLTVELAAIVCRTGPVESDDRSKERHPGVERVAGSGPAVYAVRIEGRIDRRELPVTTQYRWIEVRI